MDRSDLEALARRAATLSRRSTMHMLGAAGLAAFARTHATAGATKRDDARRCKRQVGPCKARLDGSGLDACCEKLATCKFDAFLVCAFSEPFAAEAMPRQRGSRLVSGGD